MKNTSNSDLLKIVGLIAVRVLKSSLVAAIVAIIATAAMGGFEVISVFFIPVLMLLPALICFHVGLVLNLKPKTCNILLLIPMLLAILWHGGWVIYAGVAGAFGEGAELSVFFFFQLFVTAIAVVFAEFSFVMRERIKKIFSIQGVTDLDWKGLNQQFDGSSGFLVPYIVAALAVAVTSLCPAIMDYKFKPDYLLFGVIAALCIIPAIIIHRFWPHISSKFSSNAGFISAVIVTEFLVLFVALVWPKQVLDRNVFLAFLLMAYIALGAIFYYLAQAYLKNRAILK